MTSELAPLLEVSGLAYAYRGLNAVTDCGFTVPRGEIIALIGANGAGKTTSGPTSPAHRRIAPSISASRSCRKGGWCSSI